MLNQVQKSIISMLLKPSYLILFLCVTMLHSTAHAFEVKEKYFLNNDKTYKKVDISTKILGNVKKRHHKTHHYRMADQNGVGITFRFNIDFYK